jgi:hypothetical protein
MIRISVVSSPTPPPSRKKQKQLRSTSSEEEIDPETISFLFDFLKAVENESAKYSAVIQLQDDCEDILEQVSSLLSLTNPELIFTVSFNEEELPETHPLIDQGVALMADALERARQQLLTDTDNEEFL